MKRMWHYLRLHPVMSSDAVMAVQGEAYDDDEGYDEDPYNDGDNEGPIY